MPQKEKTKPYIDVNLPREWEYYLNELLERPDIKAKLELVGYTKTYSGLGKWIIRQYLLENTSFRFKHINTNLRYITIFDLKLNRHTDVEVREKQKVLYCPLCEKTDCEHVKFVFKIPEIDEMQGKETDPDLIKILERIRKERWKVPDV